MKRTYSRRGFLGASLLATGAVMLPRRAVAAGMGSGTGVNDSLASEAPVSRRLRFYNTHTAEKLDVTYFEQGVYHPDALAEINFILRDFRVNETAPISTATIDLVHDLTRVLDIDAPVDIICGFRSAKTNEMLRETRGGGVAKHSLHLDGLAIDLRIPGRALSSVRDAALAMKRGGVGFYAREDFVHVDTGRVRRWG